jgi:hypothetical protein
LSQECLKCPRVNQFLLSGKWMGIDGPSEKLNRFSDGPFF